MSEALPSLPKTEVLEEDIGVFLMKTTCLPIPTQIRAASKVPKKTSHHLLEVIDFIPTTTGLELNQDKKREFHVRVSHGQDSVQKRVGTEDKETSSSGPRNKTHLLLQRSK